MPGFIRKVATSFKEKRGTRLKSSSPFVIGSETIIPRLYLTNVYSGYQAQDRLLNNYSGKNWHLGNDYYDTKLDSSIDTTNGTPENNYRQPQWDGTQMMTSSTQWSYRVDAAEQQLNWGIQFDVAMMNYFWMTGSTATSREACQTGAARYRTMPFFMQGFMVRANAYNYTTYTDVTLNPSAADDFRVYIQLDRIQGHDQGGAYNGNDYIATGQAHGSEHSIKLGPTIVRENNVYSASWTNAQDSRQAYYEDAPARVYRPKLWYEYFSSSLQPYTHYGQGPAGTNPPYGGQMSVPAGYGISSFDLTRTDDKFNITLHGPVQECRFGGPNPSINVIANNDANTNYPWLPRGLLNPDWYGPGTGNGYTPNTWEGLYNEQKMEGCPSWVEFSNYHYVFRYTLDYLRQDHGSWNFENSPDIGGVAVPTGFAQERSVHDWRTLTDSTVERVHSFQWLNDGHDCYVLGYETENIGGTDYYSTYLYHFEIDSTQHNDWWDYSQLRQIEKVKIADKDGEPFGIKDVYEVANPPAHFERTYWGNLNLSTEFLMDNRWVGKFTSVPNQATTVAEWNDWPKIYGVNGFSGQRPTILQLSFSVGGRYGLGIGEPDSNSDIMLGSSIHHFRTDSHLRSISGLYMEHDPYTSLQNEFALTSHVARFRYTDFDPERMFAIPNRVFNYKMPMAWSLYKGGYYTGDWTPKVGPRYGSLHGREVLFMRERYFQQKSQLMSCRVPTGRRLESDTITQQSLDSYGRYEYINSGVGAPFNQRKPTGIIGTDAQTLDKLPNPTVSGWNNLPDEQPLCAIFSPDGMKFLYWTKGDNKTNVQTVRWTPGYSQYPLPVLNRVNLQKPFDLRTALMNEDLDADGVPNLYRIRADDMFETNLTTPYDDVFPTTGPWSGRDGKNTNYQLFNQMYRFGLPINMEWGNCREYGEGAVLENSVRVWNYSDGMCLITQWDTSYNNDGFYQAYGGNLHPDRQQPMYSGGFLTYSLIPPTTIRNANDNTDNVFENNPSSYDIVRMTPDDEELTTRFVRNWIPLTTTTNDYPILTTDLRQLIIRPTPDGYDSTYPDPDSERPLAKYYMDSDIRPWDPLTSIGMRARYLNFWENGPELTPDGGYALFYGSYAYNESFKFKGVRFYDQGNRALIIAVKSGDSCAPDRMYGCGRWFGDFTADHDVFQDYVLEDFYMMDTERGGDQNFEVWFDCKLSEPYMLHSFAQPNNLAAPEDATNFRNMGNMSDVYFSFFETMLMNKSTYMPTAALENFQLLDDGETLVRYRAGSFQTMKMYAGEFESEIKGRSGVKQWILNRDENPDNGWPSYVERAYWYEIDFNDAGWYWNQQQKNTSYDPISTATETTDLTAYNCWAWNGYFTNPTLDNARTFIGKKSYIKSFPSYLDMTEIFYKLGYTSTYGLISPNGDFPVVLCPRETSFAGWGKVKGNYYEVNNTLTSPSDYNGYIMQRVKSNPNVPFEEQVQPCRIKSLGLSPVLIKRVLTTQTKARGTTVTKYGLGMDALNLSAVTKHFLRKKGLKAFAEQCLTFHC